MNRTNFYNEVTIFNTKELDFLHNSLTGFEMNYDPSYYRVTQVDIMRPDLISYKNYGTVDFWWIICLVNGIENPLDDLEEGQILKIPNQFDIFNFQNKYRIRRNQ